MRFMIRLRLMWVLLGLVGMPGTLFAKTADNSARPNFLVIVADDLGYSDLGAFGGEIATPNLDKLAYGGIRFTEFHSAPWCVPTRAMLMSGTDPNLALTTGSGADWPHLRANALSLAELMADAGYRTVFSGKWHLGDAPEQNPQRRGFQRSFALLEGEHNHFGRVGLTLPTTYTENGQPFTTLPKDFYSSDYFASRLIGFLRETKTKAGAHRQPFFAYLAFTAPHAPLQAPAAGIAKYRGRYDAGFDVLKEVRLARQKALGLLDAAAISHPPLLFTGYPLLGPKAGRWNTWCTEEQKIASRDMEVYAGMIDRLDQNVGRVVAALKDMGELDNTVILFLSDNGAQGAVAGKLTEAALEDALNSSGPNMVKEQMGLSGADNRLENRGAASSWVRYAPGWAEAVSAPSWLYKMYATEGGTRVVSFLRLPHSERRGQISHVYLSAADVLPTFLDLAGVSQPGGSYRGHAVQPLTGRSWAPWLKGSVPQVYGPKDAIGMADMKMGGTYSLRQGDWKITDVDGIGRWKLFNIATDPGEVRDLSKQYPERKAELLAAFEVYAKSVDLLGSTEPKHSRE